MKKKRKYLIGKKQQIIITSLNTINRSNQDEYKPNDGGFKSYRTLKKYQNCMIKDQDNKSSGNRN